MMDGATKNLVSGSVVIFQDIDFPDAGLASVPLKGFVERSFCNVISALFARLS